MRSPLTPDRWARPLNDLGIERTHDLMPAQQRKVTTTEHGLLLIDGGLFCPSTPEGLRHLPPFRQALPAKAVADLTAQYDERVRYAAYVEQGRSTGDGYVRVACPARRGGGCGCGLVGPSLRRSFSAPTVTPPDAPGGACCQATVTIPPNLAEKERQKYPYGTSKW